MLILQRKAGESLVIGEDITIRVVSVDGTRVRLAISAPEDVPILRSELLIAATPNPPHKPRFHRRERRTDL